MYTENKGQKISILIANILYLIAVFFTIVLKSKSVDEGSFPTILIIYVVIAIIGLITSTILNFIMLHMNMHFQLHYL